MRYNGANAMDTLERSLLITDISSDLYDGKQVVVDDLAAISIPVRSPVICRLFYRTSLKGRGMRMAAYLNGELVLQVQYDGQPGLRVEKCDITRYLESGQNELRCRCLVSRLPHVEDQDEGIIVVEGGGATAIKKTFRATGDLEPYDMAWLLRLT
jgi:hypothetical protein